MSNHYVKRKKPLIFCLTGYSWFVFYMGTTAAGITLNDEKFRMLYGNHIRSLIRRRTGLSHFLGITYGLWAKVCYADSQALVGSYLETIYT